jgi:elongation factor Ts
MAEVTTALVAQLRERTGAGLMDCKKALVETNADLQAAIDLLRKRSLIKDETRGTREAREGVIAQYINSGGKVGVLVEVNCETDFVAKNEVFREFAGGIARKLASDPKAELEADRLDAFTKIRENIRIPRSERYEVQGNGLVAAYIHTGAKVGVLVEVGAGQQATTQREDFKQVVRDITLQIAAASPVAVDRDGVDAAVVEKEKEIATGQAQGKPPQAIAKIVEGKLAKFFQTHCLLEQGFVKANGEITVREQVARVAKQLGDELTIRRFARFQVGERASD